jgi:hypothetical protein
LCPPGHLPSHVLSSFPTSPQINTDASPCTSPKAQIPFRSTTYKGTLPFFGFN